MSDPDYLTAKRTVDDRALNDRVFEAFVAELNDTREVSILEIGAGTGTMIARLAERGVLPANVRYRAIDREQAHVDAGRSLVPQWLAAAEYHVEETEHGLIAIRGDDRIEIHFEVADAFAIEASPDVCVASAVLDLVDLPEALDTLSGYLEPGGLLYAPITFDGGTGFAPADSADAAIEQAYHRHMADIRDGGGPDAGRRLLEAIPGSSGEIVAVGGSAQVIHPRGGSYPDREGVVLSHLLETVGAAVREVPDSGLAPEQIDDWLGLRRNQFDRGELSFVASNLDVLARL